MKGSETKFDFSNLPKLSRAHLTLAKIFSASDVTDELINKKLSEVLSHLDPIPSEKLSLEFRSCEIDSKKKALSLLGRDSLFVFGDFSKENIPFVVEIPERTVIELVYILLGSQADISSKKTVLTPIEEGIFSFVLTLVANALQKQFFNNAEIGIHFSALESCSSAVEILEPHAQILNFVFELGIEQSKSQIRVLVAATQNYPLVNMVQPPQEVKSAVERGIQRASETFFICSATIGQFSLAKEELNALEVDDVVVLESSRVELHQKTLSGQISCQLGAPPFANANAHLFLAPEGHYSIKLDSVHPVLRDVSDS
jgi:flagellar motor switch protein FliM